MSRQYLRIEDALNMVRRWPINVYHAPAGIFYETWNERQFRTFIQKWSVELSGPIATARGLCLYSADLDADREYFFQTAFPTRAEVVEVADRLTTTRQQFEEWKLAAEAGLSLEETRQRFCRSFSADPELEAEIERTEAKAKPGAGSLVLGGQGEHPRSGDAVLGGD
jgi:hypothetical protein